MIDRLRSALEAATPRPWEVEDGDWVVRVGDDSDDRWIHEVLDGPCGDSDAALIVLAVNHLDTLLHIAEAAEDLVYQRADGLEDIFEDNFATLDKALAALKNAG